MRSFTPEDLARIAGQVEQLLLDRADWVPSKEIVAFCGFRDDRLLRADYAVPRAGLFDKFAVSCHLGFKHVNLVSNEEFEPIAQRLRRHGVGELKKRLTWIRTRQNARQGLRPQQVERFTGQVLLGLQEHHEAAPRAHVGPCRVQTP